MISIGHSPSSALAATCADCIVAERCADRLTQTMPSAPSSCRRRNVSSNAPTDGAAVSGSTATRSSSRQNSSLRQLLAVDVLVDRRSGSSAGRPRSRAASHDLGRKVTGTVGHDANGHGVIVTRACAGHGFGGAGWRGCGARRPGTARGARGRARTPATTPSDRVRIASPVPVEPMPRASAQVTPATAAAATTALATVDASRARRSRGGRGGARRARPPRRRSRRARTRARARGRPTTGTAGTPTRC